MLYPVINKKVLYANSNIFSLQCPCRCGYNISGINWQDESGLIPWSSMWTYGDHPHIICWTWKYIAQRLSENLENTERCLAINTPTPPNCYFIVDEFEKNLHEWDAAIWSRQILSFRSLIPWPYAHVIYLSLSHSLFSLLMFFIISLISVYGACLVIQ